MGTSSTLFNSVLAVVNGTQTTGILSSALQSALTSILANIGEANDDIAYWVNPFYNYHTERNPYAVSRQLTLVDGGEDDQNVPLYAFALYLPSEIRLVLMIFFRHPLIQPVRNVDVIFAVDSSAGKFDAHTPLSSLHR